MAKSSDEVELNSCALDPAVKTDVYCVGIWWVTWQRPFRCARSPIGVNVSIPHEDWLIVLICIPHRHEVWFRLRLYSLLNVDAYCRSRFHVFVCLWQTHLALRFIGLFLYISMRCIAFIIYISMSHIMTSLNIRANDAHCSLISVPCVTDRAVAADIVLN